MGCGGGISTRGVLAVAACRDRDSGVESTHGLDLFSEATWWEMRVAFRRHTSFTLVGNQEMMVTLTVRLGASTDDLPGQRLPPALIRLLGDRPFPRRHRVRTLPGCRSLPEPLNAVAAPDDHDEPTPMNDMNQDQVSAHAADRTITDRDG